jgi:nucleotide-binding universal stress UspA family protein
MSMFKTILVAVDGSTGNERILLFAEHLARVEQASLVILHAYQPPSEYEWTDAYPSLLAQYEALAAEVVQDALEVLQTEGVEAVTDIRKSSPAEAVLAAARAHNADLIIVGSRTPGREGVAETLLGSVSLTVLRAATCPVLVVP